MSEFEDWLDDYENTNGCITIGAEQASLSAYNAGRAYQREVDAKIAESVYGYGSTGGDAGDEIAQTIREQKID